MQATRRIVTTLALAAALFVTVAAPGGISPPTNQSPPTVTGTAQVGQTLTCSEGGWNGTQPIAYAFQWMRSGTPIPGATVSTYVLTSEDDGAQIVCAVTASNGAGSASASSSSVTPVGLSAPAPEPAGDTIPPTVTGFSISPRKFRILYLTCKNNKKTKIPRVEFNYTLSENANLKITTRYAGSDSKKAIPGNHDGTMAIAGNAGDNKANFGKELHGRYVLLVGKYTATIVATDAAGNQSNAVTLAFRVLLAERGDGKRCVLGQPGKQPKLKIP
ncbi:MAG: hypothetical protein HY827_00835 [Actinobacteria bacterium]|nr:hypothetical protein [Actinomycetota bacterium]